MRALLLKLLDKSDNIKNENSIPAVDPPLALTSDTEEHFMANMANPFG
jgi:hypothetical protein